MNNFNIREINENAAYKAFIENRSEDDLTYRDLLFFIDHNSDNINVLTEFLIDLSTNLPQDKWFGCFIRCCGYAHSADEFKPAIDKAYELLPDIDLSNASSTVFSIIEDIYIKKNTIFSDSKLLERAASIELARTQDRRYLIFKDYAFIYTSRKSDENRLKGAVKSLSKKLKVNDQIEVQRCMFYLMCQALIKLAFIKELFFIESADITDIYRECLFDWYSQLANARKIAASEKYDICKKIKKYNCPEVKKLFEIDFHLYSSDFRLDLLDSISIANENNRYSIGLPPIVQNNCLFCQGTDKLCC